MNLDLNSSSSFILNILKLKLHVIFSWSEDGGELWISDSQISFSSKLIIK